MERDVKIYRDSSGVVHIDAKTQADVYYAMGYAHALDRGMQMLLMRILGQGRLSECLDDSDESLEIDIFFRKMGWHKNISACFDEMGDFEKDILTAYCEGVNERFKVKIPWEYKLMGYSPEPWEPADIFIIARMLAYLTLSQSQDEMERLFVEMVKNGVPEDMLHELFPGILFGMDIELIKKVSVSENPIVPASLWKLGLPRMMASNNWVISGKKTASGKPILANDPHLEVNRLPNVWYEVAAKIGDRFVMGASMPGAPAFLIGRNPEVAWGATYAFTDSVDSWIEECRDGKYRVKDEWKEFEVRKEVIRRKKKPDVEVFFHENRHGVLDGDPAKDGFYLATRWSAAQSGAKTLSNVLKMWDARTVTEGMDCLGRMESFWSFVLADSSGNIGFQMSGLVPKRRDGVSGFVPLPGWDEANDWQGMEDYKDLPSAYNPEKGYFVTANQDLNPYGGIHPINMPMGIYRAERIASILEKGKKFTVHDVFDMHFDFYSTQAERFMNILRPLLPDTKQGRILRDWDCEYGIDSKGAFLFEEFYKGLYLEVFGKNGMGEGVIDFLASETGAFIDFYANYDRILLSEESAWFAGKTRDEVFSTAAVKYLDITPQSWGKDHRVLFKNILFDGKLPRFLGFDKGPYPLPGGRATIHQGQIYRSANRDTTFFPSYRFVTDFSESMIHTTLAGGPSDRRFSCWYTSDLKNWMNGNYKKIEPEPEDKFPEL